MERARQFPLHLLLLGCFIPLILVFRYVEAVVQPVHLMTIGLDYKIPFIKEFVVAYLMWFPYIISVFVFCAFRSRKEFFRLCGIIFSGMCLAYLFFMLYPNYIDIRPAVLGNDVFSKLLHWLYSIDTPTNVFPSLHVYIALVLHQCVVRLADQNKEKGIVYASFAVSVLIIISTVFIKQHSMADVFSGMLFSILMLKLFGYRLSPLLSTGKGQDYYAVEFEE